MGKNIKEIIDIMLTILICILVIYGIIYTLSFTGRDSTDSTTSRERSGLRLYTDHGTGCQYLRAGFFSPLQPRLDKMGYIVCEDPTKEKE